MIFVPGYLDKNAHLIFVSMFPPAPPISMLQPGSPHAVGKISGDAFLQPRANIEIGGAGGGWPQSPWPDERQEHHVFIFCDGRLFSLVTRKSLTLQTFNTKRTSAAAEIETTIAACPRHLCKRGMLSRATAAESTKRSNPISET